MADAITHWNDVLLEVIRKAGGFPGPAARAAAMMHAATYDAVNSIAPSTHRPYLASVPAAPTASIDAAIAHAAHDVLVSVFPTTPVPLAMRLADAINVLPAGSDIEGGKAVGKAAAAAMIADRLGDGADDDAPYIAGMEPGQWRPTDSTPAGTPNWRDVRPFVMPFGQSFRPSRPAGYLTRTAMLQSIEYAAQVNEVKGLGRFDSATRTDEQTLIARFWANDLDGTYKPPGQLLELTRIVSEQEGLDLVENARLFALVALGLADAAIAAWDAKFDTNLDLWRPQDAIRQASTDDNGATEEDAQWLPLSFDPVSGKRFSPPFPAYISGHATLGSVHAAVMRRFFGTDNITYTATTEDPNLPAGVKRTFNSFTQAALENARSRIYNGVHFQWDADNGFLTGTAVGEFVFDNALLPVGRAASRGVPRTSTPSHGGEPHTPAYPTSNGCVGRVYVMSNQATGNSVTVYDRDIDGGLTQNGVFPTGGLGSAGVTDPLDSLTSQGSLAMSQDQRFLFAVNAGSNEVSSLAVDGDKLISVSRVASGGTFPVSVTSYGKLVYVLHRGNPAIGDSSIAGFTVGPDGTLSALPGSIQTLVGGPGAFPAQVRFSPDGKQLVVSERTRDIIDVLPVGANGVAGPPVRNASSGSGPFGFTFAGKDLLIVSELNTASASSYRLGADGKLAVVSGAVSTAEEGACWVAVPNGTTTPRFAYVSNATSGTISAFNIDTAGALSLLNPSGHIAVTVGAEAPLDSAVSSDGRFLYIVTGGFSETAENPIISDQMSINAFKVEASGNLTPLVDQNGQAPAVDGLAPGTQGIVAT
jgi:6-phosphogluconolactonase (cycloisomerase 2 family)